MTPEAQRIAIAESFPQLWEEQGYFWSKSGYLFNSNQMKTLDPLEDLNVMNGVESIFDKASIDVRSLFLDLLVLVVGWGDTKDRHEAKFECEYRSARATAPQRAEAFLRTIAKWEEEDE